MRGSLGIGLLEGEEVAGELVGKADPAEQSLHDRRHADAERNAANGLAGENDGVFAALAGQPVRFEVQVLGVL